MLALQKETAKVGAETADIGNRPEEAIVGVIVIGFWAPIMEMEKSPMESKIQRVTAVVEKGIGRVPVMCLNMLWTITNLAKASAPKAMPLGHSLLKLQL